MSATNHTQNYDLSQFVGGDIPSWLNDYNGDMSKIDAAIASVAQGSGDVAADVASLKSRMTAAEADIDAAESNISTLQSTASTQGAAITQNANNITTTNNNVSALDTRVTALENASGDSLDLTAHQGTATVTPETGVTLFQSDSVVKYALNDDGTIGKIYGSLNAQWSNLSSGDNKLCSIAIPDMMTLGQEFEVILGATNLYTGSGSVDYAGLLVLKFTTNKTVDVYIRISASRTASYSQPIALPASLYFISQGC